MILAVHHCQIGFPKIPFLTASTLVKLLPGFGSKNLDFLASSQKRSLYDFDPKISSTLHPAPRGLSLAVSSSEEPLQQSQIGKSH